MRTTRIMKSCKIECDEIKKDSDVKERILYNNLLV